MHLGWRGTWPQPARSSRPVGPDEQVVAELRIATTRIQVGDRSIRSIIMLFPVVQRVAEWALHPRRRRSSCTAPAGPAT
eukprot:8072766-Pyramimonas_sp.AAC.1